MPSVISAGTTAGTAVNISGDTTGNLAFQTNGTTTALTLNTSQNATFVGSINSPNTFGFKNRIINGAMVIDQRNNGAQLSNTTSSTYNVDRWLTFNTQVGKFTVQQNAGSVTPPAGFSNYVGITSNAYTLLAGDFFGIDQIIEGYNIADLAWGTANAKTITVSFWVRSSLTGTFSVGFQNAGSLFTNYTYTISSANTWEYKTITVVPPTTGTWGSTNGIGLQVYWSLGGGSTYVGGTPGVWASTSTFYVQPSGCTNIIGTNGTTFYLTGVQVEVGSAATSFDFRSYGQELALCQRYTYRHSAEGDIDNFAPLGLGRYYGTNTAQLYVPFKVTMRTSPSSVTQIGNIVVNDTGLSAFAITLAFNETSSSGATVIGTTTSGTTAGNATTFYANGTSSAALIFSAELT